MPSTTLHIPKHEDYLRGYIRPEDTDLELARERARRAAAGEATRRRVGDEPELRVRKVDGDKITTAAGPRVVVNHLGVAVAKREDVEP
ncbi:hypothetical protein [Cellulomonas sp. P5_E12]